ncbi:MAG: DUF1570 domain-containing protein [Fuerstiella sp.]|nr:DUF1570 domain-containing protein [Fuerstiella sp.]
MQPLEPDCRRPAAVLSLPKRHAFRPSIRLLVSVLCCLISVPALAGSALIRVSDGTMTHEGKIVGLSRTTCSLMDRQGQLTHLSVGTLHDFEKVSARYEPFPVTTFREQLRKEFSGKYEVVGTTHYLVCAPSGRASRYAQLFESIYRDVEQFYRVRGFKVQVPEVPLVAVVFGSQQEFSAYCVQDNVTPSASLMGYYSLRSNRVALFDDANLVSATDDTGSQSHRRVIALPARLSGMSQCYLPFSAGQFPIAAAAAVSGNTANTIIHETTHQVGYNIGIHSRLGGTPIWIVEGLATVLEPAGMRKKTGRQLQQGRINQERAQWFVKRQRPGRAMGSLAKLVAADSYFFQQTLNSYSEAWSFTFFLLENPSRRRDLVTYLQILRSRDPLLQYTSAERLSDFQKAFGNISRIEVEFIRYMDRL